MLTSLAFRSRLLIVLAALALVPAIAVTGYASVEDAARALAAGFQAHLAKPFEMDELLDLVQALVPSVKRRTG